MSLQAGQKLAHYEILEPLGKGGMGEVHRARDTKLGREVAIKVLPEEFSQDTERVARFEREARLLASLNHPNVATLYGLEDSGDSQFLVMEVVEGETLVQRIARGPIPVDEALALFKEIAEGLEAAHEKGAIHRDLKPANVKVTADGKPKILDFGLAKEYGRDSSDANLSESPTMARGTTSGVILGTAPYMSPEQTRGTDVDKRTDIWAFGYCLFEALTGLTPFVADTVTDTLARIIEREPGWESLPDGTPSAVHRLLRRCLQKKRSKRLQSIGDARLEIEDALTAPSEFDRAIVPGVGEELRTRTWKRTALVAIGVALICSLVRRRCSRAGWCCGSRSTPNGHNNGTTAAPRRVAGRRCDHRSHGDQIVA